MDFILNLWTSFNAYAKSNPIMAGAVSLWGLSILTFVCRKIPTNIVNNIYRQITTSLSFDNTELGWARENYASFMDWYMKNKWSKFSRSMSLHSYGPQLLERYYKGGSSAAVMAIGDGGHFFFYKRRLFLMSRTSMEKAGRENVIYNVTLTMFGRNKKILQDLLDEFCYKFPPNKLGMMRYKGHWEEYAVIDRREINTVIIEEDLKKKIVDDIEKFRNSQDWYIQRGLPWKKTFVLHGIPGTGKTSLIKALASHFNLNVCRLNLNMVSDESLEEALARIPSNSILAIEDFDSARVTQARRGIKKSQNKLENLDRTENIPASGDHSQEINRLSTNENGENSLPIFDFEQLSLSGILNALDGIASLRGTLIFLTTNTLEQIDPALLRNGRVDHIYELKPLSHNEVVAYIKLMYPNEVIPSVYFHDILGCDLQAHYFEHHESFENFINVLPKTTPLTKIAA